MLPKKKRDMDRLGEFAADFFKSDRLEGGVFRPYYCVSATPACMGEGASFLHPGEPPVALKESCHERS